MHDLSSSKPKLKAIQTLVLRPFFGVGVGVVNFIHPVVQLARPTSRGNVTWGQVATELVITTVVKDCISSLCLLLPLPLPLPLSPPPPAPPAKTKEEKNEVAIVAYVIGYGLPRVRGALGRHERRCETLEYPNIAQRKKITTLSVVKSNYFLRSPPKQNTHTRGQSHLRPPVLTPSPGLNIDRLTPPRFAAVR